MNVLFINTPFNAIRPAIGVSLLKSHLQGIGVASRILYLNMRFARRIGGSDYHYLAELAPPQSLVGDWVFSQALFGTREDADAEYLRMFATRFGGMARTDPRIETLRRARALAGPFIDECLDEIDWSAYDLVGFTSTFAQHVSSLALARRVKERFPHLRILFGGANCEAEMGLQLQQSFPFVDYVCSGEADLSLPQLVGALLKGAEVRGIPGVISRVDDRSHYVSLVPERVKELDTLPFPNYDDYFEQLARLVPDHAEKVGVLMESSRGCWWGEKHHCTFCGLNGTSMAFRSKSADRVLDEIGALSTRYRPQYIEMVDNILDMHYFRDLLPELQKRSLKLGLFYETKANLKKDQVRALRDAGVGSIQPGIESLSTDVLRIMRKGTTGIQNVQLLKWCKELGVKAYWNMLYGFPGENPADYNAMPSIIDAINHLEPPHGVGAVRLDRFSPNYFSAGQLGVSNVRPDRSYGFIYDLHADVLTNIAYYFEHDYTEARNPEEYVGPTTRAIKRWQAQSESRGLVYADHGDTLAVWDFRSGAARTLTLLDGLMRDVYLFCDQCRSRKEIDGLLQTSDASGLCIDSFLDRLVRDRLMIYLDARYLSLAIATAAAPVAAVERRPRQTEHLTF